MYFGLRLKELREAKQMTLRELGTRAGMDYVLLNKIENGARIPPRLEGIMALADALNLNADETAELVDLAAQDNDKSGPRFSSDELRRIKESKAAHAFFTRIERERRKT